MDACAADLAAALEAMEGLDEAAHVASRPSAVHMSLVHGRSDANGDNARCLTHPEDPLLQQLEKASIQRPAGMHGMWPSVRTGLLAGAS